METIEINGKKYQLDVEKAKELELLKEKDSKPRSWEEYDRTIKLLHVTSEYDKVGVGGTRYDNFATKTEATAFCALGKLIQLRDSWYGNWKPDWDEVYTKYTIVNAGGRIELNTATFNSRVLAFLTKEMAIDFLETFRDLIEEAKMFL